MIYFVYSCYQYGVLFFFQKCNTTSFVHIIRENENIINFKNLVKWVVKYTVIIARQMFFTSLDELDDNRGSLNLRCGRHLDNKRRPVAVFKQSPTETRVCQTVLVLNYNFQNDVFKKKKRFFCPLTTLVGRSGRNVSSPPRRTERALTAVETVVGGRRPEV